MNIQVKFKYTFKEPKILRHLQYRIRPNTASGKKNDVQNTGCVSKCRYGADCLTWT